MIISRLNYNCYQKHQFHFYGNILPARMNSRQNESFGLAFGRGTNHKSPFFGAPIAIGIGVSRGNSIFPATFWQQNRI